jgi:preprotein translocase subunit SecG
MSFWHTLLLVVHVLAAVGVIVLVLLQHGKGADMGAAFGGGASGSVFGATGSANFLSRSTSVLAVVFFLTSLGLAYLATNQSSVGGSVMDAPPAAATPAPSQDVPPPTAPAQTGDSKAGQVPQ